MELMARYEDNHFDLAIVDPPYGIETKGNAQDRFNMGKDLSLINDAKPNKDYFNELFRVSKNQIIWGYNHLSDMLPKSREFIFWYKHQPVITFSDGELAWTSFLRTAKCFDYPFYKANQDNKGYKIHPTQKPVKLYEWLLMNYAKEGDKILDTHLGSGSIAIACHNLGYDLTACELDKEYYEASLKRINQHKAQLRLI
jgi:site-specific DNA-methyltransferase (adenine-specific)